MVVGLQRYGFFWLGRLWDSGADSGNWFVVKYLCGLGLNGRKSGVRLAGGWWFSTGSSVAWSSVADGLGSCGIW